MQTGDLNILVTGGAGYIGSHTVIKLVEAGFKPIIVDNWSNSNRAVLKRIQEICGQEILHIDGDIRNETLLHTLFDEYQFHGVIHFAGLKAVGESTEIPLQYYDNNVCGSIAVLKAMQQAGCCNIVFSSSCTVYGDPEQVPIKEDAPLSATNPYGQSKLMVEHILRDASAAQPDLNIAILRYFNPVGAHPSGLIGEDPLGIPNNLVPYIAQVAVGKRQYLNVWGDDYPTKDGTGVRDYIHVMDLADAHVSALNVLKDKHRCVAYNIGTGRGYSVLDVVQAFSNACGAPIPYEIKARRPGDIAEAYAAPEFSERVLGWRAKFDIERMMLDHWKWQRMNPSGYGE